MKHLFAFGKTGFPPSIPRGLLARPRPAGMRNAPGLGLGLGLATVLSLAMPIEGRAQQAPEATEAAATPAITASDGAASVTIETNAEAPQEDPVTRLIQDGDSVDLDSLMWLRRPVVIFADSPADPRYHEQMEWLRNGAEPLLDRDVIVLIDTDPSVKSALRKKLRPRGFMLVLLGKDGGIKLRKPQPLTVRELSRSIDKFPDRLREVEERREN